MPAPNSASSVPKQDLQFAKVRAHALDGVARRGLRPTLLLASSVLILLPGCKPVGPNYTRPAYTAPTAYKESPPFEAAAPSDEALRGDWWQMFADPQLNTLEQQVTQANPTLQAAQQSYLAARSLATAAHASLYPTLAAGPSMARNSISKNGPSYSAARPTAWGDFLLTGQAAWEPDLWGRVRRQVESAQAAEKAAAADRANVDLSLHTELAQDYFALRGVDSLLLLLRSTVRDLESQLDLTQKRLDGGVATEADLAQARTQLETVRAQLVDATASRAQLEHAVGTLAGQPLGGFSIAPGTLDAPLPSIPAGLPSRLLERRPDIAAAERRTAQANAQIGIAIAAFYPSLTLGGSGGFESLNGGTWIQGPSALWALGVQAGELLFDAGRRRALADQAIHAHQAQAAVYRATVLSAFHEVEDRLSDLRILSQESALEDKAVASAQHSLDLANVRYQGGVTSYLEVLTAEQALLANQRTAIALTTRRYAASVGLIRALGGGWSTSQTSNPTNAQPTS